MWAAWGGKGGRACAAMLGRPLALSRAASGVPPQAMAESVQQLQLALPRVALVGAPNVGKSTLYNRLTKVKAHGKNKRRSQRAIVDGRRGSTRDRREDIGRLAELRFTVIDTPGLELLPDQRAVRKAQSRPGRSVKPLKDGAKDSELWQAVAQQTAAAVSEAHVVILMYDARAGLSALDAAFGHWLRTSQRPSVGGGPALPQVRPQPRRWHCLRKPFQ